MRRSCQAWVGPVKSAARDITLNYSAVGSGAGIAAITGRTVDFGASDAPLSPDQFSACKGCVQIPWALASTSVFYNLPGNKTFCTCLARCSCKIYLGKITNWNNPAIKKINPGTNLPDQQITVVHRSDGSGTTYNFTDYLSSVSKTWKSQVGKGTAVNWPTGTGETAQLRRRQRRQTDAWGDRLRGNGVSGQEPPAVLQDAEPVRSFRSSGCWQGTLAAAQLQTHPAKDGSLSIVNPPKSRKYRNAYPISTYTYILLAKSSPQAAALRQLVNWAITKGQKYGPKLFFQPIPAPIVKYDKKPIKKIHS